MLGSVSVRVSADCCTGGGLCVLLDVVRVSAGGLQGLYMSVTGLPRVWRVATGAIGTAWVVLCAVKCLKLCG